MNTGVDVALILWNRDVIELMSLVLLDRNLKSCGLEPSESLDKIEALIAACRPSIVVFDLCPPYDRSAAFALRLSDRFSDCEFVMTCADSVLALKKAPWLSSHLIFQKPYQIDEIADALRALVRGAPTAIGALSVGAS